MIPNQKLAEPNEAAAVIVSEETNGLSADEKGFLKGTPEDLVWGDKDHADYEIQTVYIPVKVTLEDKGIKQEKQVMAAVNVERDTDRNGIPNRADEDDDGDGVTDNEETAKGSDPKDAGSFPGTEIEKMDAEIYRSQIEREEIEQGGRSTCQIISLTGKNFRKELWWKMSRKRRLIRIYRENIRVK